MPAHRTVQMHMRYAHGLGGAGTARGVTHPDQKGQIFPHLEVRDRIRPRLALKAPDPAMASAAIVSMARVNLAILSRGPGGVTPRRRMLASSVIRVGVGVGVVVT